MSQTFNLDVNPREVIGKKTSHLRREGILPGVIYGYHVDKPLTVQVDRREFERVYRRAGANSLIDLHMEGSRMIRVFVHEVTRHPVSRLLTHVDFTAVNLTLPIMADVALVLIGEAPATKEDGIVLQTLDTLHVRALPTHLPSNIEVDISGLTEIGQTLHVSDLTVPADVEVLTDPETAIVHITAAQLTTEEEETTEEEGAESGDEGAAEESSES